MENPFKPSEKYQTSTLIITLVFAFLGIAIFAYLDGVSENPYLIASFGATAVLIYGAPKAAFSKPKNVFFGHLFSALIGITIVIVSEMLGIGSDMKWVLAGLAVSVSIVFMMVTGTIHPPGGATALTCVLSGFSSYIYVIRPVMIGVVTMMALAYCANYLHTRFKKLD